jgi:hypothetical protein
MHVVNDYCKNSRAFVLIQKLLKYVYGFTFIVLLYLWNKVI